MTIMNNDPIQTDKDIRLAVAAEVRGWLGKYRRSQTWLADVLGLGRAAIVKKLAGDQPFSLEQLLRVATAFDITLGQLLGDEVLNAKSPRPAVGDEGVEECSPPDSNRQPTD